MTQEKFNKIVEEMLDKCKSTLIKKQNEYNLDNDRLSFFKEGNELTKLPPERILYLFMFKHIKSLADMIASEKAYSKELWEEKIQDNINYLLLLRALLEDDKMFKDTDDK
jgi:hypothetical protein